MLLGMSGIKRKNSEIFDPDEIDNLMKHHDQTHTAGEDSASVTPAGSGGGNASRASLSMPVSSSSSTAASTFSYEMGLAGSASTMGDVTASPMHAGRRAVHRKSAESSSAPSLGPHMSMVSSSGSSAITGSAGTTGGGTVAGTGTSTAHLPSRGLTRASSLDYYLPEGGSSQHEIKGRFRTHSLVREPPSKRDNIFTTARLALHCGHSTYRIVLVLIVVFLLVDRLADMGADDVEAPRSVMPGVLPPPKPRSDVARLSTALRGELNRTKHRLAELENQVRDQQTALASLKLAAPVLERVAEVARNESRAAVADNIYDNSNAYFSLLDNLLSYGSKQRWVFPCTWDGCYVMSQGKVLVSALTSLGSPARKTDKDKFRVLVLGNCATDALYHSLQQFGERLQSVVVVASADKDTCGGQGRPSASMSVSETPAKDTNATAQKQPALKHIDADPTSADAVGALANFANKFFDAIFIDAGPSATMAILPVLRTAWLPKIRNDGLIIGHGYGVQHPASSASRTAPVSWLKPPRLDQPNGQVLVSELATVKLGVDALFLETRNKDRIEVDPLRVAGDTTWYFYKRKISISDVFGNGGD